MTIAVIAMVGAVVVVIVVTVALLGVVSSVVDPQPSSSSLSSSGDIHSDIENNHHDILPRRLGASSSSSSVSSSSSSYERSKPKRTWCDLTQQPTLVVTKDEITGIYHMIMDESPPLLSSSSSWNNDNNNSMDQQLHQLQQPNTVQHESYYHVRACDCFNSDDNKDGHDDNTVLDSIPTVYCPISTNQCVLQQHQHPRFPMTTTTTTTTTSSYDHLVHDNNNNNNNNGHNDNSLGSTLVPVCVAVSEDTNRATTLFYVSLIMIVSSLIVLLSRPKGTTFIDYLRNSCGCGGYGCGCCHHHNRRRLNNNRIIIQSHNEHIANQLLQHHPRRATQLIHSHIQRLRLGGHRGSGGTGGGGERGFLFPLPLSSSRRQQRRPQQTLLPLSFHKMNPSRRRVSLLLRTKIFQSKSTTTRSSSTTTARATEIMMNHENNDPGNDDDDNDSSLQLNHDGTTSSNDSSGSFDIGISLRIIQGPFPFFVSSTRQPTRQPPSQPPPSLLSPRIPTTTNAASDFDFDDESTNNITLSDTVTCAICLQAVKNGERIGKLDCQHVYHVECLKPWLQQDGKNMCPMCRRPNIAQPTTDPQYYGTFQNYRDTYERY